MTLVLSLSLHQVRAKHVTAMMMQMLIAMAVTSVTWWLVGYSLAFGNSRSYGLIGDFSNACYLGVAEMTVLPGSTSPLTVPGVAYATFQVHLLHTYTPTIHLLHTYYTPTIHLLYTYYVVLYSYHTYCTTCYTPTSTTHLSSSTYCTVSPGTPMPPSRWPLRASLPPWSRVAWPTA